MKYRAARSWLAAALLLSSASAGVAQLSAPTSAGGSSSAKPGASAAVGSSGLNTVPEDFSKLTLAPGFLVSLNVLDDPDFGGTFRVDQQGGITVPILGTLYVAGETVSAARIQIRNKLLEDKFLKDPQVNLAVLEYTPPQVTIVGEVASPGKYPLLSARKLVDVLALAGGTTLTAGNEVLITRDGAQPLLVQYSRTTDPKLVEEVIVDPADTVQVKRAGIVYVLGEVNRPGGFVMQEAGTLNVLQAMSLASGTTKLASSGTIYLLRRNANGFVVCTKVPFAKIAHGKSADVQLDAKDVLYIPTSKIKSLYADTQAIMNSAATAGIYAVAY